MEPSREPPWAEHEKVRTPPKHGHVALVPIVIYD